MFIFNLIKTLGDITLTKVKFSYRAIMQIILNDDVSIKKQTFPVWPPTKMLLLISKSNFKGIS